MAYVRSKIARRHLSPDRFGLTPSDIALDSIAELFRQDSDAGLVQIRTYFTSLEIEEIPETELLGHLRRLVFSKVNQGIFRLYGDEDPSFGKILRNIKLSIQALHNFVELERFGEHCIAPALCDRLEHLPSANIETLEASLLEKATGVEHIPALLSLLGFYLRNQAVHSRVVSMNLVAIAFRSVYCRLRLPEAESTGPENHLLEDDIKRVIVMACTSVKQRSAHRYVETKGVSMEVFLGYFKVIEAALVLKYVEHDGKDYSLFKGLQGYLPGLTREEYSQQHRSALEYLLSLSEKSVVNSLRN